MLQAWYMDDSDEDQRLPHHREPKEFVSLDQLAGEHFFTIRCLMRFINLSSINFWSNCADLVELGVLSWRLDADNYETDEELKKIRTERGYSYMVRSSIL